MNKLFIWSFAVVGVFALLAAIFSGAYHHFFTAALCAIMCLAGIVGDRQDKKNDSKQSI
ncbi:MAG: hypothetical protein VB022_10880 [Rikenellaceae bacterium]|nr:hypothetical protein [Rikenellaceae bacterium]